MAYIRGDDINMGIGKETTRGTPVSPSQWIPARTPTGVSVVVDKGIIRETRGTGVSSQGSFITEKRAEGDLEFNVRNNSLGLILLSLFGQVSTTTPQASTYQHVFNILTGNPQFPTLTLGLAQNGQQDYQYKRAMVTSLEIRTPVDDLVNATATFIGADEVTIADYTPAFVSTDYHFHHYDVVIKLAANVAGLAGATAQTLKEFSLSITNNGRTNRTIGSQNPTDVLAIMHEISGSLTLDYDSETFRNAYVNNTVQSMQIEMTRTDITLGTSLNPKLTFVMPAVTFVKRENDRPIDDIASEKIDFMAHYSTADTYAVRATLINQTASY